MQDLRLKTYRCWAVVRSETSTGEDSDWRSGRPSACLPPLRNTLTGITRLTVIDRTDSSALWPLVKTVKVVGPSAGAHPLITFIDADGGGDADAEDKRFFC